MADHLHDDALYPGSVVRRLLEQAGQDHPAHWLELAPAAEALGCPARTLRYRCARWARMETPPIRVRKSGPEENSHWRLHEEDVYAYVRQRDRRRTARARTVTLTGATEDGTIGTEVLDCGDGPLAVAVTDDPFENMCRYWEAVVDRELSP